MCSRIVRLRLDCVCFGLALAGLAVGGGGACERESRPTTVMPPAAEESSIDFPPAVQSDDPEVNRFVRKITETCVGGDYENFRLLWSVHEAPFPRREFERGWKALKKVRVLALEKMKTPDGEYLYSIHARVELDESVPEPAREVVLLIVRENDQWRLAQAPAHHREKVLDTAAEENANANSPDHGDETSGTVAPPLPSP